MTKRKKYIKTSTDLQDTTKDWIMRSHKCSKDRKYSDQKKKKTLRQAMIYRTLLKIEQHEPYKKLAVNSGVAEGKEFQLNQTYQTCCCCQNSNS